MKTFEIIDKKISVRKDCKRCDHIRVCKFHSKMADLCNSNEFYGMTEYLESNNSLEAFEIHSSCRYFKFKFKIPKDKSVGLDVDLDILTEIAIKELKLKYPNMNQYSISAEKDEVSFTVPDENFGKSNSFKEPLGSGNSRITIKLSELLIEYKFK
jgi:hypothetical protein